MRSSSHAMGGSLVGCGAVFVRMCSVVEVGGVRFSDDVWVWEFFWAGR